MTQSRRKFPARGRRWAALPPPRARRLGAGLAIAAVALGGRLSARRRRRHRRAHHGAPGWPTPRPARLIENKPGASTNISIQAVVNAPADGNTMLFIAASAAVNVSLFDNLPFDLQRDIVPVSGLIDFPLVMLANPRCRPGPSRS